MSELRQPAPVPADAATSKSRRPGPELRAQLWDLIVERDWPAQVISVRSDSGGSGKTPDLGVAPGCRGPGDRSKRKDGPRTEGTRLGQFEAEAAMDSQVRAKTPPAYDVQRLDKDAVDELRAYELEKTERRKGSGRRVRRDGSRAGRSRCLQS